MTTSFEAISTDELLYSNPVNLERQPDLDKVNGDYRYSVIRVADNEIIGKTRINFWADGTKELARPEIWSLFQGFGYGIALYVAASEIPNDSGDNPVLQAQVLHLSDSAVRVWRSLVRRGLAEGSMKYSDPYRFIRKNK